MRGFFSSRALLVLFVLFALAFALYAACVLLGRAPDAGRRSGEHEAADEPGGTATAPPAREEPAPGTGAAASEDVAPALAIVVDDCGGSLELARRLISLDLPLTWSIIPYLRYSEETADLLRAKGIPFLAHVPMQALSDPDDEAARSDGLISAGMAPEAVRDVLEPMLDSLPGACGINNHRGSKATADAGVMNSVMSVLAERGMIFVDSRTSSKSVAYDAALENGLISAKNSHFLDNESDRSRISEELSRVFAMARNRGSAIAICHLRPETVAFFEDFKAGGMGSNGASAVRLVTLPQLMESRKGENR
jgi:polysaccharide deacetylase 2 family uncharacterized protein YibQ